MRKMSRIQSYHCKVCVTATLGPERKDSIGAPVSHPPRTVQYFLIRPSTFFLIFIALGQHLPTAIRPPTSGARQVRTNHRRSRPHSHLFLSPFADLIPLFPPLEHDDQHLPQRHKL